MPEGLTKEVSAWRFGAKMWQPVLWDDACRFAADVRQYDQLHAAPAFSFDPGSIFAHISTWFVMIKNAGHMMRSSTLVLVAAAGSAVALAMPAAAQDATATPPPIRADSSAIPPASPPAPQTPPASPTLPTPPTPQVVQPTPPPKPVAKKRGAVDSLRPGQFVWENRADYINPLRMVVVLDIQRIYVFDGDDLVGFSTISSGKKGKETPTGVFKILQKKEYHESNLYANAPMPFMQRLTWDGIALHAGNLPGYPASHGCIRLPKTFAKSLYGATELDGEVVVLASLDRPKPKPQPVLPPPPVTPPPVVADPVAPPPPQSPPVPVATPPAVG
jgi:lipoprotein-anchoring transpeptidase ErfK/SrfK